MSDLKSKLPDVKEVTGMLGKLFKDVKQSVVEIAGAYKEKHKETAEEPKAEESKAEKPKAKAAKAKAEEPKAEEPKAEEPKAEEPKAEEPPKE
ncbi:MAG: hypothetical protein K0U37_04500 [Gammaproteobacteria bacterium]|nr:hypothetical protein [Gammaproteobacteria bacterium]